MNKRIVLVKADKEQLIYLNEAKIIKADKNP